MRRLTWIVLLTSCVCAGEMPSGQGSAEGAAASFHTALVRNDPKTYQKLQHPKLLENPELAKHVSLAIRQMADREILERPEHPIGAIADFPRDRIPLGVRTICRMGAISSASAVKTARDKYSARAIGFVDLDVVFRQGRLLPIPQHVRTFVIQDEDGKWYVLPRPDLFPALTQGLNDEKPTGEVLWRDADTPAPIKPTH